MNLLSNAVKFSVGQKREVTVSATIIKRNAEEEEQEERNKTENMKEDNEKSKSAEILFSVKDQGRVLN